MDGRTLSRFTHGDEANSGRVWTSEIELLRNGEASRRQWPVCVCRWRARLKWSSWRSGTKLFCCHMTETVAECRCCGGVSDCRVTSCVTSCQCATQRWAGRHSGGGACTAEGGATAADIITVTEVRNTTSTKQINISSEELFTLKILSQTDGWRWCSAIIKGLLLWKCPQSSRASSTWWTLEELHRLELKTETLWVVEVIFVFCLLRAKEDEAGAAAGDEMPKDVRLNS